MNKTVYKNDNAFDFSLVDVDLDLEQLETEILGVTELTLKDGFDWANERELEDLYGDFND